MPSRIRSQNQTKRKTKVRRRNRPTSPIPTSSEVSPISSSPGIQRSKERKTSRKISKGNHNRSRERVRRKPQINRRDSPIQDNRPTGIKQTSSRVQMVKTNSQVTCPSRRNSPAKEIPNSRLPRSRDLEKTEPHRRRTSR